MINVALVPATLPGATAERAALAPLEIIIAPDSFQDELLALKAWRESQGLRTDIVTISHLVNYQTSVGARDLSDAIHQYITVRKAADAHFEFLLLVGDDPVVPTRVLQVANRSAGSSLPNYARSFVSDFFYGVTASDFLNECDYGDEYPGGDPWDGISDDEWVLAPDLHVGRIPVGTETELSDYLGRLLEWEARPQAGPWLDRAVFALPVASPPGGWAPDDRPAFDASVVFAPAMGAAAGRGLSTVALADYPEWPLPFVASSDNLSEAQLLAEWEGGAAVVVVPGRDNPLAGGPGTEYAGDGSSAVFQPVARPIALDGLGNGAKLPVAVAAFGSSANFSLANDFSIERAVLAPGGGAAMAIGFAGPTAFGAGPGDTLGGWTMASLVVEELLASTGTVGEALDGARARFVAQAEAALGPAFDPNDTRLRSIVAGLTLLGDPASSLWAGSPQSLALDGPGAVPPNTRANVTYVVTAAGTPVANATVALLDEWGDLRGWGRTDASGAARFEVATGNSTMAWTATATAPGYRRVNATLAIDSPPTTVIVSPGSQERIGGTYLLSGLAGDPDINDTVVAVHLSIDGGPWQTVAGTNTWSLALETLSVQNGPHELRVRAFDGRAWGPAAQVTFNVTNPLPPLRIADYPAIVIDEDKATTFDLDLLLHFAPTGPGGTLTATIGDAESVRATLNGSSVELEPDPDFFGMTELPVTVSDSYGGHTSFNLTIVVAAKSDPPVLTVRSNTSVLEGGVITFDPRAFDPDGTTPTVLLESGPPGATITGWEAPRRSEGTYLFVFSASDGGFITRVTVNVTVLPHNKAPQASLSAPERGEAGRELAFEALNLIDADGDPVTVEWQFGDGQRATGTKTSHVYATPGDYVVVVTLSDGRDSLTLQANVHVDPYTAPGVPSAAELLMIAFASVAVIAGALGFAAYQAIRSRRPAPENTGAGDPDWRDTRQGEEE